MRKACFLLALALLIAAALNAEQANGNASTLPLKRVSLFSSGVGYFEHTGAITGNAKLNFSFGKNALNDALKSLVINDGEAGAPQINYLSDTTLQHTLQSLKIDLSSNPGLPEILRSLKGTEIIAHVNVINGGFKPEEVRGRIVAVDMAGQNDSMSVYAANLSLATNEGIRTIDLRNLVRFMFTDAVIQRDLGRALDLIGASNVVRTRDINIELSGKRRREVSISYVIPTPVWKISYRLDLNQSAPLLQAWAIVDNDGDIDWDNVEVSLVSGRPVSFIQALYPPYYTNRPILPLAGAGFAEAQTYDSGLGKTVIAETAAANSMFQEETAPDTFADAERPRNSALMGRRAPAPAPGQTVRQAGQIGAALGQSAGEQFEFTLKKPVRLERQQSAMLPLFDGAVTARKILVFSGQRAASGVQLNPSIGVELTNSTGLKLPAGSITVFNGGTYAGDALIDFTNTGDKRLISYGDDLSVTGTMQTNLTRSIDTVRISKGLLSVNRKIVWNKTYTIRNAAHEGKRLIIEHPKTQGASLVQPAVISEQTAALYRFEMDLRADETLVFTVSEESPAAEQLILANLSAATLLAYAGNGEIPERSRSAIREAVRYKTAAEEAKKTVTELEEHRNFLVSEQERIRANLQAAGNQTAEGRDYLAQLITLDKQIGTANTNMNTARSAAATAQNAFESYVANLEI
jgi:hypothetical protein